MKLLVMALVLSIVAVAFLGCASPEVTQGELDSVKSSVDNVANNVASVESDLGALKAELAGIPADIAQTQADATSAKAGVESLRGDVTNLQNTIVQVEGSIATLNNAVDSLDSSISGNVKDVKDMIAAVEKEIAAIKTDLADMQAEIDDLMKMPAYGAGLDVFVSDIGGETSVVAMLAGFDPTEAVNLYLLSAGSAGKDIDLAVGIRPNASGAAQVAIPLSKFFGVSVGAYTVKAVGTGGSIAAAGVHWKG
jgi:peptidoglycan hydrolase CwlO-like protein